VEYSGFIPQGKLEAKEKIVFASRAKPAPQVTLMA